MVGRVHFGRQRISGQQLDGTTNQIYVKITKRLGFVALVTAASFFMIEVTISMVGSWRENGKKVVTISRIPTNMRLTVMAKMNFHLLALFVGNLLKTQS